MLTSSASCWECSIRYPTAHERRYLCPFTPLHGLLGLMLPPLIVSSSTLSVNTISQDAWSDILHPSINVEIVSSTILRLIEPRTRFCLRHLQVFAPPTRATTGARVAVGPAHDVLFCHHIKVPDLPAITQVHLSLTSNSFCSACFCCLNIK